MLVPHLEETTEAPAEVSVPMSAAGMAKLYWKPELFKMAPTTIVVPPDVLPPSTRILKLMALADEAL